jgi:hypothetical protein
LRRLLPLAAFCRLPPSAAYFLLLPVSALRRLLPFTTFFFLFAVCLLLLQPSAAFYRCFHFAVFCQLHSAFLFPPPSSVIYLLPTFFCLLPKAAFSLPATSCRHLHSVASCRIVPYVGFSLLPPSTFCRIMLPTASCLLPFSSFRHLLLLSAFPTQQLSAFCCLLLCFDFFFLSSFVFCLLPHLLFAAICLLPCRFLPYKKPPNAAS